MLIKKLPSRKISLLPPFLRNLVKRIFEADGPQLSQILTQIVDTSLPKSDLNNWIGVLNKFDRILESLINKYHLQLIQINVFSPEDKELLVGILTLTKTLFDKCTNRNLYCSYERLNELLNTNDMDILELILGVIIRPAQRVNTQRSVRVNFLISQDRIAALSQPWGTVEADTTLKDLCTPSSSFKPELQVLRFQFYMNSSFGNKDEESESQDKSSTKPPSETCTSDSSQVLIDIPDPFTLGSTPSEIFKNIIRSYKVPHSYQFKLFQKIRVATSILDTERRLKLMSIRLLATAVYCYVASDNLSERTIFVYEPNFISHLAGLLNPSSEVPTFIQTSALHTLDSIAHYSGKFNEVLGAIGASSNHGILMLVVKKVVSLENIKDPKFMSFVDVLFTFLLYVFTSQTGGNMLITAGIIPTLSRLLSKEMSIAPIRLLYKGIQILDNAIYGFTPAFASFQGANGLEALVARIEDQVETCIELGRFEDNSDKFDIQEQIKLVENMILLKGIVKFVLHMMQTSTSGVGLRNLIDSSLPRSLKKIFELPGLFSPMVYAQAINVMSTIIHNEPTSLAILQEQGLPQTFLKNVVESLPASGDSLCSIINSYGAICLNKQGIDFFTESGALSRFFDIFTSPEFIYVLDDTEALSMIGGSFDELIRHHPSLKQIVLENVISVIKKILHVGSSDFEEWSRDALPFIQKNDEEIMRFHLTGAIDEASDKKEYGSIQKEETLEQFFLRFIDAIGKFLDGFFQNSMHFDEFFEMGGVSLLLDIYSLPSVPQDFPATPAAYTLAQVFRAGTEKTLTPMVNLVLTKIGTLMNQASPWLEYNQRDSYVFNILKSESPDRGEKLRDLLFYGKSLHGIIDLLSEFCDPTLFNQGNVNLSLIEALIHHPDKEFIPKLGHLLSITQWDCIYLRENKMIGNRKDPIPGDSAVHEYADPEVKQVHVAINQINAHLSNFFQGLTSITITRRILTPKQKKDSKVIALKIAEVLKDYLCWSRVWKSEKSIGEVLDNYAVRYSTTSMAFISLVLLDHRHQLFIHILIIMAFEKVGGFDELIKHIYRIWDFFVLVHGDSFAEGSGVEFQDVTTLLSKNFDIAFHLLECLVSCKLFSDSPHLPNLVPSAQQSDLDASSPNDYLYKIRFSSCIMLSSFWAHPAILKCTKRHITYLVNTTNHLIKNQLMKQEAAPRTRVSNQNSLSSLFSLRRPEPDESRVLQLIDMGFPRNAAETALVRCANNITRATDYLLTHPEIVASASFNIAPENTQQGTENDMGDSDGDDNGETTTLNLNNSSAAVEANNSTTEDDEVDEDGKGVFFLRDDIHNLPTPEYYEVARENIAIIALKPVFDILDSIDGGVFPIRDLMITLLKDPTSITRTSDSLFNEIDKLFSTSRSKEETTGLARRLRLLGFLLIDDSIIKKVISVATRVFPRLVELVAESIDKVGEEGINSCISTSLVIIDILMMYDDEPKYVSLEHTLPAIEVVSPPSDPTIKEALINPEHRNQLIESCSKLLSLSGDKDSDLYIAVLRLVSRLTRNAQQVTSFVETKGLDALLSNLKVDLTKHAGVLKYLLIILRHLIESKQILLNSMEYNLTKSMSTPKPEKCEIMNFLKYHSASILRDPEVFIEATLNKCKLVKYDPRGRLPLITLVQSGDSSPPEIPPESSDKNSQIPILEINGTSVIYFLVSQLLAFKGKNIEEPSNTVESGKKQTEAKMPFQDEDTLLQCTIMQLLNEFFYCFPSCRFEFLSSRKHRQLNTEIESLPSRSRSLFINYLLNDLLPYKFSERETSESIIQVTDPRSSWASYLISSFLIGQSDLAIDKISHDLAPIRRFVLDLIFKCFQDTLLIPDLLYRYGKIMALCELCHRVLSGGRPPRGDSISRPDEDASIAVAKIMLDKKFVTLLVNILNEVDLNFPNVRTLVTAILNPLEVLSKIAIKLGHKKGIEQSNQDKDVSDHEMSDVLTESASEDEAADMLRNSALGVIDGTNNLMDDDLDGMEVDSNGMQDDLGYSSEASDEATDDEEDDIEVESDMFMDDEEGDEENSSSGSSSNSQSSSEWEDSPFEMEGEDNEEGQEDVNGRDPLMLEEVEEAFLNGLEDEDEDGEGGEESAFQDIFPTTISGAMEGDDEFPWIEGGNDPNPFRNRNFLDQRPFSITGRALFSGLNIPVSLRSGDNEMRIVGTSNLGGDISDFHPRRFFGQQESSVHPLLANEGSESQGGPIIRHFSTNHDSTSRRLLSNNLNITATQLISQLFNQDSSRAISHNLTDVLAEALRDNPITSVVASNDPAGSTQNITEAIANSSKFSLKDLSVLSSHERWQQEARILFSPSLVDYAPRVLNSILNVLIPKAKEEQVSEPSEQNQNTSTSTFDPQDPREALQQILSFRRGFLERQNEATQPSGSNDSIPELTATSREAHNDRPVDTQDSNIDLPETEETPQVENAVDEHQSESTERVIVMIHGEAVDVTDLGIDPTFFDNMPDDMRREILDQHVAANQPTQEAPLNDELAEEFFNAIPPELRNEVIQNERNQAAAETQTNFDSIGGLSALGIINNETLRPNATIPPGTERFEAIEGRRDLMREFSSLQTFGRAGTLFSSIQGRELARNPGDEIRHRLTGATPAVSKTHRDALQLVDRQELSVLTRLIFMPQAAGRNFTHRLLLNLCENHKTCNDLIVILLSIIQDGADDLASVDRSFANLSLKTKSVSSKNVLKLPEEMVPNLITQRSLETLAHIMSHNDYAIKLFMKESEGLGLKRTPKKSKHKDKMQNNKYPIVTLISLLERPKFLDNSGLLDQLMHLISTISKYLSSLIKHSKAKGEIQPDQHESSTEASANRPSGSHGPETSSNPKPSKHLPFRPPTIPEFFLKTIVGVLSSGECSNKTFQYTLSTIQHLSILPGAEAIFDDELIDQSRNLGQNILSELIKVKELLSTPDLLHEVQGLIISSFSPATSLQARFLRLLKTLDYIYTRKKSSSNQDNDGMEDSSSPKIYTELQSLDIWNCLSETLLVIQENNEYIHIASVLLPLIEAFMVICKHGGFAEHISVKSPYSEIESDDNLFLAFTDKHRKLLNLIVRNNPSLMSGTFSLLIKNHKVLEFDNKRTFFQQQIQKRKSSREFHGTLQLNVRRQDVFQDSFRQFQGRSGDEIKYGKLNVKFHDEEGIDAGGVTREWFSVLCRQMFDPNNALFKSSALDRVTYQPNQMSWINPDHLQFFKFVGRVIGKAIYTENLLDAYFTRSFYKHILGKSVEIRDLEALDPEYYKSLVWMLENDITDVMDLNFTIESDEFGASKTISLKPNGENIPVTQDNKFEYVKLVTEQKLYLAIKDQIDFFLKGFHEIIPKDLISIFDEQELELLISGLPDIDIDDWKNNTDYEGYTHSSPQIQWFWRAVRSFDQSEKAKLLQFVTGTSKVPLEGFSNLQGSTSIQKFQIHRDFASVQRLPSAHTCFNQLDIPLYEKYEDLRRQLLKAIEECNTGFGFG